MLLLKNIIKENDVADDAESVGKDSELIDIAEMAVDVHLFCSRAGSRLGRHKGVSHGVWVNFRPVLIVGFEPSDKGIEGFGIVFVDVKLNTGGVKGKDLRQPGTYHLADGFCIVHHVFKHEFNISFKVLFETGQERWIRHFGKATEIPEFPAQAEKKEQKESEGMEKIF